MAKISRSGSKGFGFERGLKSNKSETNKAGNSRVSESRVNINHSPFLDALNEVEFDFDIQEINKSLEYLEELGKDLVDNPNMSLLKEYKKRVKAFLKEALKRIYKLESREALKSMTSREQKVYINIEKIDEALEELTMKFIQEQGSALNIINDVEGIQGLLYSILA